MYCICWPLAIIKSKPPSYFVCHDITDILIWLGISDILVCFDIFNILVCLNISDMLVLFDIRDILVLLLAENLPVWWTPGASYPAPQSFRLDPRCRPSWWSGWGWFCVGSRFHPPRLMRWSLPLHSGGEGRPRQSCDILHTTPVYIVTHWAWCQRDAIYYTLYKTWTITPY